MTVFHTSSATILSSVLPGLEVRETGRTSSRVSGVLTLGTGIAKAFFHLLGNTPSRRDELKMSQNGFANSQVNSLKSLVGMSSGPGAFEADILLRWRNTWCSLRVMGVGLAGK